MHRALQGTPPPYFTPDGAAYRNTSGNPGMAKGGSGDVLAGMLVSLCGQGIDAVPAACTAAWLHGRAGDLAANALSEYGMDAERYADAAADSAETI